MNDYIEPLKVWFLTQGLWKGIEIVLIIVITLVAIRLTRTFSSKLFRLFMRHDGDSEIKKRADTLSNVIRLVVVVAICLVAAMMLLEAVGIEIAPLLAGAGIVGLAIGFGAQNVVQDVISGFFILLENQIRVGDVVQIAGKGGLVEQISLRTVVLRDLSGNVHYVRNGQIDTVTNMTKDYSRYVFDIGVAYRENVDEVIEIIKQVDAELREDPAYKDDILAPIEILGLDQFAESAIIIKARTMTKPIQQWRIGREFNRRLKMKFDQQNIEIPFPHVTLYMGQGKDGAAPPLRVAQENQNRPA